MKNKLKNTQFNKKPMDTKNITPQTRNQDKLLDIQPFQKTKPAAKDRRYANTVMHRCITGTRERRHYCTPASARI